MAVVSKKMAIISKIKALVSKTGILWRSKTQDNEISEKIAQKIQKNSYDLSLKPVKDSYTPPYLQLAEQLEVADDQIFRAAAYNMSNIAMVRKKYREDIVRIFNDYLKNTLLSEEKHEFLRQRLAKIDAVAKRKK